MPTLTRPVASITDLTHRYGKTHALDSVAVEIPSGCMVGLIGPDGVGKSTLMGIIAGAKKIQAGKVQVLGGDIADRRHRNAVCPLIAYMPQGLGKNLYFELSVFENIDFFAQLFGLSARSVARGSTGSSRRRGSTRSRTGRPGSCRGA